MTAGAADTRPKVRVLPPELADQIAAGEVVERPASVVKELVENALDAGARRIDVEIEAGGRRLVRVVDDGCGMTPDEARLALQRHATSKIAGGRRSVGARDVRVSRRGAAVDRGGVAADAAHAHGRRRGGVPAGRCEAGAETEAREVGMPVGTQVEVRDLFFNTPARAKFLKTEATETAQHLRGDAAPGARPPRRALPAARQRPASRWTCRRTRPRPSGCGRRWPGAGRARCTRPAARRAAARCAPSWPRPRRRRARRASTFLFVGAALRARPLAAARADAWATASCCEKGRYPLAALFLDVPGEELDVNVHPQKLEVRFARAQEVYAAVRHVVGAAIARAPWLRAGRAPARCGAFTLPPVQRGARTPALERRPARAPASRRESPDGGRARVALARRGGVAAALRDAADGAAPSGAALGADAVAAGSRPATPGAFFAGLTLHRPAPPHLPRVRGRRASSSSSTSTPPTSGWPSSGCAWRTGRGPVAAPAAAVPHPHRGRRGGGRRRGRRAARAARRARLRVSSRSGAGTVLLRAVPELLKDADPKPLLLRRAGAAGRRHPARAGRATALDHLLATMACHSVVRAGDVAGPRRGAGAAGPARRRRPALALPARAAGAAAPVPLRDRTTLWPRLSAAARPAWSPSWGPTAVGQERAGAGAGRARWTGRSSAATRCRSTAGMDVGTAKPTPAERARVPAPPPRPGAIPTSPSTPRAGPSGPRGGHRRRRGARPAADRRRRHRALLPGADARPLRGAALRPRHPRPPPRRGRRARGRGAARAPRGDRSDAAAAHRPARSAARSAAPSRCTSRPAARSRRCAARRPPPRRLRLTVLLLDPPLPALRAAHRRARRRDDGGRLPGRGARPARRRLRAGRGRCRRSATSSSAPYLDGALPLADAVAEIVRTTVAYARRQRTWFRKEPAARRFESEPDPDAVWALTAGPAPGARHQAGAP